MARRFALFISSLLLILVPSTIIAQQTPEEEIYFALEMNDKLVGYALDSIFPGEAGKPTEIRTKVVLKLIALGQDFDIEIDGREKLDPKTGKHLYIDLDIKRGDQKLGGTLTFEGDEVNYLPKAAGTPKSLTLEEDVIVDDRVSFPYIVRDMGPGKETKKTYKVLDITECKIHERDVTYIGREKLRILGKVVDCLVFDTLDRQNGLKTKLWLDPADARSLRTEASNGIISYLTDPTVKDRIERGDLDDSIFGNVDVAIADYQSITYMKIRAKIRTAGEWVTKESLNIPGQNFTGEVKDNLVDGVFELEYQRYDGKDAPPFPPDFRGSEELKEFLEPEDMIESDDPVLTKKAREIAESSKDSWEAACRLSKWVAEEIGYSIPGGSARHTFDTRKGECGSHSRLLTAFCRSVGVPARIASGGLYTPNYGGSFGQHAWNEVYMGNAGWIPVDSTVQEVDYVDSGHIRLGNQTSFQPVEMEVLDYRAGALAMGKQPSGLEITGRVPWKVGKTYTFTYAYNGSKLGEETLRLESIDVAGNYACTSEIELYNVLKASSEWKLASDGSPLSFSTKGTARGAEFSMDCLFFDGKVEEKVVQGEKNVERTVELSDRVFLISNNCVGVLAFLAAAAPADEGAVRTFKFYHPSSMQVLPAQVTVKESEAIEWGEQEIECRILEFSLAGTLITMWVDDSGRLIRESEAGGSMVMELKTGDG